jgi:site-specific DNA-cytosine methylase
VHQLVHRGLDRVLADLDAEGYTTRPLVLSSGATGSTHKRKRIWLVAYANESRKSTCSINDEARMLPELPENLWRHFGALDVRRNDGVSNRVDKFRRPRLQALGNAVSPTQAYPILKAIAEAASPSQTTGEK